MRINPPPWLQSYIDILSQTSEEQSPWKFDTEARIEPAQQAMSATAEYCESYEKTVVADELRELLFAGQAAAQITQFVIEAALTAAWGGEAFLPLEETLVFTI